MNVLQNIASVFISPAKATAVKTPGQKRGSGDDVSGIRSSAEKRKRGGVYDAKEYMNVVYSGVGRSGVHNEEEEGVEVDEDEEEAELEERLLQEQLHAEDGNEPRHTATPKSVRRYTRALGDVLETGGRGQQGSKVDKALAFKGKLDAAGAGEPDGLAKRVKTANVQMGRVGNDAIITSAVGKKVCVGSVGRSSGGGSEEEEEEEEEEDVKEEEQHPIPPTPPHRHLSTAIHAKHTRAIDLSPTTARVEASRLKHTPVVKQPRPKPLATNSRQRTVPPLPTTQSITTTTPPSSSSHQTTSTSPSTPLPPPWLTLSPDEKWALNPNLQARLLSPSPHTILSQLPTEPPYTLRDTEIRDGMWSLTCLIEAFADTFFPTGAHAAMTFVDGDGDVIVHRSFFESLDSETVRVVGCVADSGPGGVKGWHSLFVNAESLRAVGCAVVGCVVSEQVFQHVFFGGGEEGVRAIGEVEREGRDGDGFQRKILYAAAIRAHLRTPTSLPIHFNAHVNVIVGALYTHLAPLIALTLPPSTTTTPLLTKLFPVLHKITVHAALLSLHMATTPHTIYHHVPLFKETPYDPPTMECFNAVSMRQRNMRTPATTAGITQAERDRRAALSSAEKRRAEGDVALTQIVCLQAVTAYRSGGWEDAGEERGSARDGERRFERREYEGVGIRARVLTQGWVFCRWGREGGSVDFREVEGVRDWVEREREGKGRA